MSTAAIKALLFDYGGTLDSGGRHWSHVLREGMARAGIRVSDDAWLEAYVGTEREFARKPIVAPTDDWHALMLKKTGHELSRLRTLGAVSMSEAQGRHAAAVAAAYCHEYARRHVGECKPVLTALAARYPMAIVTNFYGNIHAVLRGFGILNLFAAVVESSAVGIRKPDPRIWRMGVDALGAEPAETMAVGDSYANDIVPAASIGCHTAWMHGEGWGGDADQRPVEPDCEILRIADLRRILL